MKGHLGDTEGYHSTNRCPSSTIRFCRDKSIWGYLGIPFSKRVGRKGTGAVGVCTRGGLAECREKVSLGIPKRIHEFFTVVYAGIPVSLKVSLSLEGVPDLYRLYQDYRLYRERYSPTYGIGGNAEPRLFALNRKMGNPITDFTNFTVRPE